MKSTPQPLVSIIIPVYNSQKTLHITMESLVKQSYSQLEIIVIDDSSTDGSPELIKKYGVYLQTKPGITFTTLSHGHNKGVAAARNSGLDVASGEYIFFLDADDWIEPNAIELTVATATKSNADIIGFNWWLSFKQNERKMKQPAFDDAQQAIEWMLLGKMRWNLWMFLIKRRLFTSNSIRFIPGMNMGEDLLVVVKLFSCATHVAYLNETLYHYNQSTSGSMTKVYSDKHREEVTNNVQALENFLLGNDCGKSERLIAFLKLNIKLPLLITNKNSQLDLWRSWFKDVNYLATANKEASWRIRLLQWAAANRLDWIVKLHYYFVIRVVYGIIYK